MRVKVTSCRLAFISLSLLLTVPASAQQSVSESFEFKAATSSAGATGLTVSAGMPDGEALSFLQDPPILHPDHTGSFGLRQLKVLGDIKTLTFERADGNEASGVTLETWNRVGTTTIAGRLVSLFEPSWTDDVLAERLQQSRHGFDHPYLFLGRLVGPRPQTAKRTIFLRVGSTNTPHSQVRRLAWDVQYASHVVNILVPDFGDSRVAYGPYDFNVREVARVLYRYFPDQYESIALIPRHSHIADFGAFHTTVKNEIRGIGKRVRDLSSSYGSQGALHAVELYTQTEFTSARATSHEIGHQWGDNLDWQVLGGIDDGGWYPSSHTPLLYQGETLLGAVLDGARKVVGVGERFEVRQTTSPMRFHPLQLYRMGKLSPEDVPDVAVFANQRQLGGDRMPPPGTPVSGAAHLVTIEAIMAHHGPRQGPSPTEWRQATVLVSRDHLASQDEMNYWNFFAQRLGDPNRTGVMSYDGYPSFDALTEYAVDLQTKITPLAAEEIIEAHEVDFPQFGSRDLQGLEFDVGIPSRYYTGSTITLSGRVTATDRTDFDRVLLRLWKRAGDHNDALRFWGEVQRDGTFSVHLRFTPEEADLYKLESFLFWPGAGGQIPRGTVSPVTVTP